MGLQSTIVILMTISTLAWSYPYYKKARVTPRTTIFGLDSGEIVKCEFDDVNECVRLHQLDDPVRSLAVSGEWVFAVAGGVLRRCGAHSPGGCSAMHEQDGVVTVAGTSLFVSNHNELRQCGFKPSEECTNIYETTAPITALTVFGDNLYVSSNSTLLSCPLDDSEMCSDLVNVTSPITSLASAWPYLFVGLDDGAILHCHINQTENCNQLHKAHAKVVALDVIDDVVQAALHDGELIRYAMNTNQSLTLPKREQAVLSIASLYATVDIYPHYKGESKNCTWQWDCPPYVMYYNIEDREPLQLQVRDGKLYKATGEIFDTRHASRTFTGVRAIFVMDPVGRMFASNRQIIGLLHHSSLLAGNPVASAGEISVIDGVVEKATTCSGHYRPSVDVGKQLLTSLKSQGYEGEFEVASCFGERLQMDLYFNKLPLYYQNKYNDTNRCAPDMLWETEEFFV